MLVGVVLILFAVNRLQSWAQNPIPRIEPDHEFGDAEQRVRSHFPSARADRVDRLRSGCGGIMPPSIEAGALSHGKRGKHPARSSERKSRTEPGPVRSSSSRSRSPPDVFVVLDDGGVSAQGVLQGHLVYLAELSDQEHLSAIRLTLLVRGDFRSAPIWWSA